MLTDEERATLLRYYSRVTLSEAQKDELARAYWAATREERDEIAKVYVHTFIDPTFVQRLMYFHDCQHGSPAGDPSSPGGTGNGAGGSAGSAFTGKQPGGGTEACASPTVGSPTASSLSASPATASHAMSRRAHAQRLLRSSIQEHFPKLTGAGPYALQFGCVQTEKVREEVTALYASQFVHPDPPELNRIVTLPSSFSTRTRRRVSGSYSWYLRCLATQEIVCAVTVIVHQQETIRFAEMPLFATGVGYKKNGFGRLLNAALLAWCRDVGLEFLMISADVQAIPFWSHVGYRLMNRGERKRVDFFYQHDCCKFKDAETMIGYCTATGDSGASPTPKLRLTVSQVLKKMPRFVIDGPLSLPAD